MFGLKNKSDRAKGSDDRNAHADGERVGHPDDNDRTRDDRAGDGRVSDDHRGEPTARDQMEYRREEFGGFKGGAVFYGWLISVGISILLVGIVSAVATGVGSSLDVTKAQAELKADTIGVSAAVAIVVILVIGYFAGGYVAGRLARFDGARQGVGVWVLGVIITIAVAVVGGLFGSEYNVFERVDLPSIPIPDDTLSQGGIITLAAAVVGTLIASVLGGIAGHRYHSRIDRATI